MAYAPIDAFNYAKTYVKNTKLDDVKDRLLDDVCRIMWMAAPWRWTLGSMPGVILAANQQDYTVTSPGGIVYLQSAYVSDGTTAPRDLIVEPSLPTTTKYVGQPNRIALVSNTGGNLVVRISPVPTAFPGGNQNVALGLYKIASPTITGSNDTTAGTQGFPDEYFWVYQEGVLWRAYLYADDERAGNITFADGKVQYTGQRAAFEAGLQFMRQAEKLHLQEKPKEP